MQVSRTNQVRRTQQCFGYNESLVSAALLPLSAEQQSTQLCVTAT